MYTRIVQVYNAAWLDGEFINDADLNPMQIELLRAKLQTRWIGMHVTDEEIRLSWKSFLSAKYSHPPELGGYALFPEQNRWKMLD